MIDLAKVLNHKEDVLRYYLRLEELYPVAKLTKLYFDYEDLVIEVFSTFHSPSSPLPPSFPSPFHSFSSHFRFPPRTPLSPSDPPGPQWADILIYIP